MNRSTTVSLLLWFVVLSAVGVAFAFHRGVNDADLFWHLLNGELLLQTGRPVTEDPYSFTFSGGYRPPHVWLSEGVMYVLVEKLGPDLALALFALALPAGLVALAAALVGRGLSLPAVVLGTILPALVALPYVSVRPQVLSWSLDTGQCALSSWNCKLDRSAASTSRTTETWACRSRSGMSCGEGPTALLSSTLPAQPAPPSGSWSERPRHRPTRPAGAQVARRHRTSARRDR
jgi:hypothetical protein